MRCFCDLFYDEYYDTTSDITMLADLPSSISMSARASFSASLSTSLATLVRTLLLPLRRDTRRASASSSDKMTAPLTLIPNVDDVRPSSASFNLGAGLDVEGARLTSAVIGAFDLETGFDGTVDVEPVSSSDSDFAAIDFRFVPRY